MRYAITQRNTPQTHLKPRYTKELPARTCAEHAHAYACEGRQTLARFARSGAPDSLRCPSEPFRIGYGASVAGDAPRLTKQP